MADLYRTTIHGSAWRYGEGKTRPTAILGLHESSYPKGSTKRYAEALRRSFHVERLTMSVIPATQRDWFLACWQDVTSEFL